MWSWFWNDREQWKDTAYLFLKDDDLCWYVGNNEKSAIQDFSHIIDHYITRCKLSKNKVFTIGGSMGAYGAILYAVLLGLKGVIAINPQVNKASNITRPLENAGDKWQDLEKVTAVHSVTPNVSLTFCHDPPDQAASYALLHELKQKKSITIIRRHPSLTHSGSAGLSKEFIENEIAYLEAQEPLPEDKSMVFNEDDDEFDFY